jgi:hypothetical protein
MATAIVSWFLCDALVNSWQKLDEATQVAASTAGWIVSTGTTNRSKWASGTGSGTERAASTFDATTYPNGTLDTTLFDAWRTTNTYNGNFSSANWTVQGTLRAVTNNGGTETGVLYVRLFRSANTDGSSATEITSAAQASATSAALQTASDVNVTVTFNPGAFSVTNEYLFFQIAWGRVGAGGMTTSDAHFRTGSSATVGTRVDSAPFVIRKDRSETIPFNLTEDRAQYVTVSSGESLAALLTEYREVGASPRTTLVSILTQLQNHGIPGKRYTSFAGRGGAGPTTVSSSDTIALGLTEDGQNLFNRLARDESVVCGLTEDRLLLALLQRDDTLTMNVSDLSAVAQLLATSDTAVIGLTDATQTLTSFLNRDDTLVCGLSEDRTLFVRLSRDEAVALGLTEDRSLFVSQNRDDSLTAGLAEDRAIYVTQNRDDSLQVVIVEASSLIDLSNNLVTVSSSDSLVVGLTDAYSTLQARLDRGDTLPLNWLEDSAVFARVNRDDSLPLGLAETAQLAVNVNSAGDTLTIGLADASQTYVTVASADAVALLLNEASTVFAALNREESISVQLTDAFVNILATLNRDDTHALIVVESSVALVPLTGSDALAVGLTESGQMVEIFINRLGAVLVATVRYLTGEQAAAALAPARGVVALVAEHAASYLARTVVSLVPELSAEVL